MFEAQRYRNSMKKMAGLFQSVTLMMNNGTGYNSYPSTAHVSRYQEDELVADGSIKIGDLKVIIPADSLPDAVKKMQQKDRIEIDGRPYSVILWDDYTRKMGHDLVAIEVAVRG